MTDKHTELLKRRRFLQYAAAATGALYLPATQADNAKVKTTAHIVIAGAGAAGLALVNRLVQALDNPKITLIDPRKEHFYQPGYTLVAAGIKPTDYVISSTAEYLPQQTGVEWIQAKVAEFDPESNEVVTDSGKTIQYDYLLIATGLSLDYAAITGMDTAQIGKNGLGSVYHSAESAKATFDAMQGFAEKGGVGVFQRPNTEMKCAGAPLKYAFLTDDALRRKGTRDKAEFKYFANNKALFSVPIVSEKVRMLFKDRQFDVKYEHVLQSIDLGKRIATFKTAEGNTVEQGYDFINVIPPMKAPDAVKNSPLPWQEGNWVGEGWVEVDKSSLRHKRFPNIFAVGDIAGVPKGKTAASVKWQVPVAVDHLVAEIAKTKPTLVYEGYTSCPLITRYGQAMLVEFDYENNLVPSFPGVIAPLEELWVTWVMKTMALKPTYISMLRGHA
jgi:sulfide:quinone oxidoreductase